MNLKIGRHEYVITGEDVFINNGACVQLLSQSKEKSTWGNRPNPVLPQRAIKEINKFTHIKLKHTYGDEVEVFKLQLD